MYKEAKYIATVPEKDKKVAYLLCKDKKILVPMEFRKDTDFVYPKLKTTCETILAALKAKFVLTKIYKYQDGAFYTYVRLKHGNKYIDVNASPSVALSISKLFDVPLLVNETIVRDRGFHITKKMVEDAIRDNIPD